MASVVQSDHRNRSRRRANQRAEITADTFGFVNDGKFVCVEIETLVCAVFAGDVAEITLDTMLVVDAGDDFIVQV